MTHTGLLYDARAFACRRLCLLTSQINDVLNSPTAEADFSYYVPFLHSKLSVTYCIVRVKYIFVVVLVVVVVAVVVGSGGGGGGDGGGGGAAAAAAAAAAGVGCEYDKRYNTEVFIMET